MTMPFNDPFWSPKLILEKVEKNISNLKSLEMEFISNGIKYVVEKGGIHGLQHKLKQIADVPEEAILTVADCFTSIRSALDHTVHEASLINGMPDSESRNVSFPISSNKHSFEESLKGRCKYLPDDVKNMIRNMRPYKGGNDILWACLKMANNTKHRSLEPVYISSNELQIDHISAAYGPFALLVPVWNREKKEVVIFESGPTTKINASGLHLNVRFSLYDAYDISGQPIIEILKYVHDAAKFFVNEVSQKMT